MESRTEQQRRKMEFDQRAKEALDLANNALQNIDNALDDVTESSVSNYEHVLGKAVLRGEIDAVEASEALDAYEKWMMTGASEFPKSYQ